MARKNNVHSQPSSNQPGKWQVKSNGARRAYRVVNTQKEAQTIGRRLAKTRAVEHIKHGRDGQIKDSDSYGNDPHPPSG